MWSPFKRRPKQDDRKTEQELTKIEGFLRHQMQVFVRKVWFVENEGKVFQKEDKVALANDGIDSLVDDFKVYMRTRVKPDGTPK